MSPAAKLLKNWEEVKSEFAERNTIKKNKSFLTAMMYLS